jgi:hypothetical protein
VTLRVSACVYRSSIGIVSILNYVVSPSLASFSFRLQGTRIRKISNIFRSASTAHDVINYRNLRLYIYIYIVYRPLCHDSRPYINPPIYIARHRSVVAVLPATMHDTDHGL